MDLAAAWREWTGLPFVFAVWSARRSLTSRARARLTEMIAGALDRGMARIPEIAAAAAGPLGDAPASPPTSPISPFDSATPSAKASPAFGAS